MTLRNSRHIYDISRILTKKDYNNSTEKLLIKPVHYNEALRRWTKSSEADFFRSE